MKKNQFRTMVKEIIKEVISEMDVEEMGKQHSMYPQDDPVGPIDDPANPVPRSGDQKIADRNAAWERWQQNMKMLRQIHDEPSYKDAVKKLRQQQGDEPLDYKTM